MKTRKTLLTILWLIVSISAFSQVNLEDSLRAYFPFTGNAVDSSGNGHDGTVNGAVLTEDRFGSTNEAYFFDGNDYINCGYDPIDTLESMSFSFWINPQNNDGTGNIFSQNSEYILSTGGQSSLSAGYYIKWNNGFLRLGRKGFNSKATTNYIGPFDANTWIHIAGVYDSLDRAFEIYIQGQLSASLTSDTIASSTYDFRELHIGKPNNVDNYHFNGKIDDVRIYNRPISPDEVMALYTETLYADFSADVTMGFDSLTVNFSDLSLANGTITSWQWDLNNDGTIDSYEPNPQWTYNETGKYTVTLTISDGNHTTSITKQDFIGIYSLNQGLTAYYPFTGNVQNAVDTIYNGVIYGVTPTNDRLGIADQAYNFDGVDDFVQFNNDSCIIQTKCFTISAWARMDGVGGGSANQNPIFQQRAYHGGNTSTIVFFADNSSNESALSIRGYGSSSNIASYTMPGYGEWHHYVGMVDEDSVQLFIDGVKVSAIPYTTDTNFTMHINSIGIGKHRYSGNDVGMFNGDIDEVRIYSRSLEEQEIQALYHEILVSDFNADTTSGIAPATISFSDESYAENNITTWQWDFNNDGVIDSYEENPQWTYEEGGEYDVKLIVSDGTYTDSIIKESYINLLGINCNMIAHYSMDGNADDVSGNDFHGTSHGNVFTYDRFNVMNKACEFDGNDDYIQLHDSAKFLPQVSRTISFWMKTTQTTRFDMIDQRTGSSSPDNYNFGIIYQLDDNVVYYNYPGYNSGTMSSANIAGFNDDKWHHFVFMKDAEEETMSIYMDNNLITEMDISDVSFNVNGNLYVGKNYGNNGYFDGIFDDLRIYERAIETVEVEMLFKEVLFVEFAADTLYGKPGLSVEFTDLSEADNTITSWEWDFDNDGQVDSYEQNPTYTFDEAGKYSVKLTVSDGIHTRQLLKEDLITIYDLNADIEANYQFIDTTEDVSSGFNGINHGATKTSDRFGFNTAYDFDGINDRIAIGDHLDMDSSDFTISLWAYLNGFPVTGKASIINKGIATSTTTGEKGYSLKVYNYTAKSGILAFTIADETYAYDPSFTEQQWHHIVAVREGVHLKLYVDGNLIDTEQTDSLVNVGNDSPLTIGAFKESDTSNTTEFFNGMIDNIRIYNRALSIYDIMAEFNKPIPPATDTLSFCLDQVEPIYATGDEINWYESPSAEELLYSGNPYNTGINNPGEYTFYATQTINNWESDPNPFMVNAIALPVADFNYETDGLEVTFMNLSTNAVDIIWDFGDGNTSTQDGIVTHTYQEQGVYDVTLVAYSDAQGACADTIVQSIDLAGVGINKINNNEFRVYPNPSNGKFFIEIGDSQVNTIRILDMFGKVVFEPSQLDHSTPILVELNHTGLYLVEVFTKHGKNIRKLLIK